MIHDPKAVRAGARLVGHFPPSSSDDVWHRRLAGVDVPLPSTARRTRRYGIAEIEYSDGWPRVLGVCGLETQYAAAMMAARTGTVHEDRLAALAYVPVGPACVIVWLVYGSHVILEVPHSHWAARPEAAGGGAPDMIIATMDDVMKHCSLAPPCADNFETYNADGRRGNDRLLRLVVPGQGHITAFDNSVPPMRLRPADSTDIVYAWSYIPVDQNTEALRFERELLLSANTYAIMTSDARAGCVHFVDEVPALCMQHEDCRASWRMSTACAQSTLAASTSAKLRALLDEAGLLAQR